MNREDIIRIAHESHLDVYGLGTDYAKFADALERFASLVAKNDTSQKRVDETSESVQKPCGLECDCTDVCEQVDYKALWQQMCERCDELDKKLAQPEQKPVAFEKTVCPFCTSEWVTAEQHDRNVDRVEQEPVAWMRTSGTGSPVVTEALLVEMPEMRWNFQKPLYTKEQL